MQIFRKHFSGKITCDSRERREVSLCSDSLTYQQMQWHNNGGNKPAYSHLAHCFFLLIDLSREGSWTLLSISSGCHCFRVADVFSLPFKFDCPFFVFGKKCTAYTFLKACLFVSLHSDDTVDDTLLWGTEAFHTLHPFSSWRFWRDQSEMNPLFQICWQSNQSWLIQFIFAVSWMSDVEVFETQTQSLKSLDFHTRSIYFTVSRFKANCLTSQSAAPALSFDSTTHPVS